MSFHDFFTNLQAGNYSRPVSENEKGEGFCEQVIFPDDVAAKVNTLEDFKANESKLKGIRIRKVTGGGSYSSGTKAKFKLSIPIKAVFASSVSKGSTATSQFQQVDGVWSWITVPGEETMVPNYVPVNISSLTMYHPSPIRIENVQHDAVLSLNDPSDESAEVVILIPLKASNRGDESVDFFNKIAKHLTTIAAPDSVTGLYPETDIPTGNDWNIKKVFWLGKPGGDNISPVTDAFYSWDASGTFQRVKLSQSSTEIRYGWQPDGKTVRYYMLETPVSISSTDLSFLTRSLPPTPSEQAIHKIPDPVISKQKVLYKAATENAAKASCGIVRERMENQGPGDIMASVFSGGGVQDLLVDDKGQPLMDKDSCDPFANNLKNINKDPGFTPIKLFKYFYNALIIIAVALGTWLGLYFVTNSDYDYKYRDFSKDAGKVVGAIALKTSNRIIDSATNVGVNPSNILSAMKAVSPV